MGEFRLPTCNEMALELVCGADFWCNRHCRTSPVVMQGFWGQVWPKIGRKPEKSEYRVAKPYEFIGFGAMDATKPYEFIRFGAMQCFRVMG